MTRPSFCPACRALTITYRRPVPGSNGDVEPVQECLRCSWTSDSIH